MRSLSFRLLLAVALVVISPLVFAHDVTLTGTQSFASLDGSSADHDGVANGVFTVDDGNLFVNGTVNCNDEGPGGNSACAMAFAVSGDMTVSGALYAENRQGSGAGGAITLTVGGNLTLDGGAVISSAARTSGGSAGGAITATAMGNASIAFGSTIDSGSANGAGGNIVIAAAGQVSVDGNVLSGPSRTLLSTRLAGAALDGGTGNQVGGPITISSSALTEPAIVVGPAANIISQGDTSGAGPVTIDGCGIQVRGLVAALSRRDSPATVSIRSGKDILIDGRDLGAAGNRNGIVRADAPTGNAAGKGVDLFATETIDILGPANGLFAITSNPGGNDPRSDGGTVRIVSLGDAVNVSGNAIDAGRANAGNGGGTVSVESKADANLNGASIRAIGGSTANNHNRSGGSIVVRSYSGNVTWTNGTGDVRPVGSASGLVPADQGKIVVTACGTVDTTGSNFPVNGTATSVLPEIHTGVCSPSGPSLPESVAPLVTCNTSPVANDTAAATNEDSTVTVMLSGSEADGDSLTFTIVSGPSNGSLGAVISTGPTTATVDYTPNPDFSGTDSFVFQADDGNGGTDTATATITIAPVNDAPSFTSGGEVTVLEDSGAYSAAWATNISAGPANESEQALTFFVSSDNNALFSSQPAISPAGVLSFTIAADAFGPATVSVHLQDDGGTANGGDDTSSTVTFTITVDAVNDAPSFTAGGDVAVDEDSGAYAAAWASNISAGPANESAQIVTFFTSNDNNALFSVQPSISATGVLTFTPAPNTYGTATISAYAQDDGGTANGGVDSSATVTFVITVNGVNDPPTAGADSFATFGNTEVRVDLAASSTPHRLHTTVSGRGVLDNDADAVEGDPISITSVVGCADTTAPFDCTFGTSKLSLNADGTFALAPGPGVTSFSFQYVVTDQPSVGTPASATGTVTIPITEMIWYVNGAAAAGGNGTSVAPFHSFVSLNGAGGSGDVDAPGEYIFVHDSTVNGSLGLEAHQKLIGEGVGLTVSGYPLVAAGTKPNIVATADAVTVTVAGVEIAGLAISSSSGNGIDVTGSGMLGASASIHDNLISAAALEGIDVNAGSLAATVAIINNTSIVSAGNGLDVSGPATTIVAYNNGTITSTGGIGIRMDGSPSGNLTIVGLSNVTIDGNTAGDGISITAATFDGVPGGSFDAVSGGTIAVGTDDNPVGGAGVVLSNASGDFAFGTLTVFGGTSGVTISGSGLYTGSAGLRVSNGGGAVSAAAGVGLSVTNTTIGAANLSFTSISSTAGMNGILLDNTGTSGGLEVLGTGSANSGGTIQDATAAGIRLLNTAFPSFSYMSIANSGTDGINAQNVNGFALASSTVSDTGGTATDDGIELGDVTGAVTIANSLVTASPNHNVNVTNTAGTSSFAITGSTFSNAAGNSGINFTATGTAVVTEFTLTGSTLSGNFADGLQVSSESTSQIQATLIQNNAFSNNNIGVDLTQNGTSSHTLEVSSNTFLGHAAQAINIFTGAATPPGGALTGKVLSNTIGNAGVTGSGSAFGNGMRINVNGGADATMLVDNNLVRQTPFGRGIEIIGRNGNGGLDVTVTNNDVDPQDVSGFPLAAIFVQSNCVSVCNTVRSDVRNNVVPEGVTADVLPTFLALLRSGASTLQLVDTPPANATCTEQLVSANTGSASASAGCTLVPGPISTP